MSCGEMWSKMCHVETFLHMKNVETNIFCHFLCCFFFSRNLLCCHLRCIGTKSILSRFTHFCVEKNLLRNCACGEKRTNIRYVNIMMGGVTHLVYMCEYEISICFNFCCRRMMGEEYQHIKISMYQCINNSYSIYM